MNKFQKVSKISYGELPAKIRERIDEIMLHRQEIKANTIRMGSIGFIPIAGGIAAISTSMVSGTGNKILIGLGVAGSYGTIYGFALKAHGPQYAKEELNLWRTIRQSADPKVKSVRGNFPYLVVDMKGGLVGKQNAPKIWFVPIGRRRIPTGKRPVPISRVKKLGLRRSRIH